MMIVIIILIWQLLLPRRRRRSGEGSFADVAVYTRTHGARYTRVYCTSFASAGRRLYDDDDGRRKFYAARAVSWLCYVITCTNTNTHTRATDFRDQMIYSRSRDRFRVSSAVSVSIGPMIHADCLPTSSCARNNVYTIAVRRSRPAAKSIRSSRGVYGSGGIVEICTWRIFYFSRFSVFLFFFFSFLVIF